MSETKRTPGRWRIDGRYTNVNNPRVNICAPGRYTSSVAQYVSIADADYICRAVNCHESLVEMAKQFYKHLMNEHVSDTVGLEYTKELIAEAEGGGNG